MKKDEAMPGKYLGKGDFPQDTLCTIDHVIMEGIDNDSGDTKDKPVMYFAGASNQMLDITRGFVVNSGNWDTIEEITGQDDSEKWGGAKIVVYVDPSIMFGKKKVGGLRVRVANLSAPAQVEELTPVPAAPDDEVPF